MYFLTFETKIDLFFNAVNYATGRVDFNDSVHIVTVPAGQRVEDITVDIQIFDDDIDEASEGFVLLLEVVDPAVAPFVDLSTRNTSLGRIDDNDCKSDKTFAVLMISTGGGGGFSHKFCGEVPACHSV